MSISEIAVLLMIYTGLLIYFLIPFSKKNQSKEHHPQDSVLLVFKGKLVDMINHKKAIFALVLFVVSLIGIQAGFRGAEWHINAHSGYSPISYNLPALYTLGSVAVYTFVLFLTIGYVRTRKQKN